MCNTEAIARDVGHRPWPLSAAPWIMVQRWQRLLFAHWRVPASALRGLVPAPLVLDEYDGSAWVALTPFHLTGLRLRGLPVLPAASDFPETNLRTYVRHGDRPGVFFFTLEAASRTAVTAARALFRLPYHLARMSIAERGDWTDYRTERVHGDAELVCSYRPVGEAFRPRPGSREHFLTERYALYTVLRNGRVLRGDIHHAPWSLQPAEAHLERNTIAAAHDVPLGEGGPLLHYSAVQDTLIWAPQLVD